MLSNDERGIIIDELVATGYFDPDYLIELSDMDLISLAEEYEIDY